MHLTISYFMRVTSFLLLNIISLLLLSSQAKGSGLQMGQQTLYPTQIGTVLDLSYATQPFTIIYKQAFKSIPHSVVAPLKFQMQSVASSASSALRINIKDTAQDKIEAILEVKNSRIYSLTLSFLIISKQMWDQEKFFSPVNIQKYNSNKNLTQNHGRQMKIIQITSNHESNVSLTFQEYLTTLPFGITYKAFLFTNQLIFASRGQYLFNLTITSQAHYIQIVYHYKDLASKRTIFPSYQLILKGNTLKSQLSVENIHMYRTQSHKWVDRKGIFIAIQGFFFKESSENYQLNINSDWNQLNVKDTQAFHKYAKFTYFIVQMTQNDQSVQNNSKRLLITCPYPTYPTNYQNHWTVWEGPSNNNLQTCQACPTGCYSCVFCSSCKNFVNCTSCKSGFNQRTFTDGGDSQTVCLCPSGSYPNATTNTCTSCSLVIPNCASCQISETGHYSATCATCNSGYYPVPNSGSQDGYILCSSCTSGCSICVNVNTCKTCFPGLTRTNGRCYCATGLYFSSSAKACVTCSVAIPGCSSCVAGLMETTCAACPSGYYISTSGTCVACSSNCDTCTNTSCTLCSSSFVAFNSSCICDASASMFLNTTSNTCVSCAALFLNCLLCVDNGTLSCTTCMNGSFFNSSSCISCPSLCATCSSLSNCLTCVSNLVIINGSCTCDSSNNSYLNSLTNTCFTCSEIIVECSTCGFNSSSSSVTCLNCKAGYYLTNDTTCSSCPTTCLNCTDLLTCGGCVSGYQLNSTTNQCDCIDCLICSSAGLPNCSLCQTNGTAVCTQCIVGSYLDNSSICQTCPTACKTCNSSTICLSCVSPFIPSNPIGSCVCNSVLLFYYNPITLTCDTCSTIITNCTSCSTSNYVTSCLSCQTNSYISNNTCLLCPFPCATCTSSSICITCTSTFTLINNTCTCDNSSQIFFNSITSLCSPCASITSALCLNCLVNPLATNSSGIECSSCSTGYFPDPATYLCSSCPTTCTICSDLSTCTECILTFVPINGQCICDTLNGYYLYGSVCLPCFSIMNYCEACQNSTGAIRCTLCVQGTYLSASNDSCVLCPGNCDSCNSTGCILCSSGYSLNGLNVCVCSTTCTNFTNADASCVDCNLLINSTNNISTLQCLSCKSTTFVVSNQSCNACPHTCTTCTDYVTCKTCATGFSLINSNCVCNNYFNEVEINSTCYGCSELMTGCSSCTHTNGVTACTVCIEGWGKQNGSCILCGSGCMKCVVAAAIPTCTLCYDNFTLSGGACINDTLCNNSLGFYYNSNNLSCSSCMGNCQICYKLEQCVMCKATFRFLKGKCVCSAGQNYYLDITLGNCLLCQNAVDNSSNFYLANCRMCHQSTTNYANGIECLDCVDGFYVSSGTCLACSNGCQKCTGNTSCCFCITPTWVMRNGICVCDNSQNYFDDGNNSCLSCTLTNCSVCNNLTTCRVCNIDSFVTALGTCLLTACGNSAVQGIETCDDGNTVNGDGCSSNCQVQTLYFCNNTLSPSTCRLDNRFNIQIQQILASCNQLTLNFKIYPFYDYFNSANYDHFIRSFSLNSSTVTRFYQNKDVLSYQFSYSKTIQGFNASFVFEPSALRLNQTMSYPLNYVSFLIVPNNNILAVYYQPQTCQSMESMKKANSAILYLSYSTLILSALPCKIIGLELFGVIQLAFLSLGSMNNVNILLTPMMGMKGVNGYSMDLGKDSQKKRLLQASQPVTPQRINSIGYNANFLRNCNAMLILVLAVILLALVLYLVTYICKSCYFTLHSISKRLIKQILLTLILFNCLNFAYSTGIHFRYATSDDELYLIGTVVAIAVLVVSILMAIALSMAEEEGFGQFKDKFKPGCVEKAYFVVTIVYRMGVGLYMSTSNEDELSTLLVLAFSLSFLLYNLVNLPYVKAYHNYRANICHFAQFICLFVTMYYRSMKSTSQTESVAKIYFPVYIQYTCIFIALIVSLLVLTYEAYAWVKDCLNNRSTKKEQKAENVLTINESLGEINDDQKNAPNIKTEEDKLPQISQIAYDQFD